MKVSDFLKLSPGELSAFVARDIYEWNEWNGEGEYLGEYPMFRVNPHKNCVQVWVKKEFMYEFVFDADTPDAMMRTVELLRKTHHWHLMTWAPDEFMSIFVRHGMGDSFTWTCKSEAIAVHIAAGLALGVLEEG